MWKIVERIACSLYLVGVILYFLRYNGMDSGLPGYLVALQFDLFGSADERITIFATIAVALIPYFAVVTILRRLTGGRPAKPFPEFPGKLLSTGAVVAILAVSGYLVLQDEVEQTSAASIARLDLNQAGKLTDGARYVNAIGKLQGGYLYVIEKVRAGRTERASVYAPITGQQWTSDQPVAYVAELDFGYSTSRSGDGKVNYSIGDDVAQRSAARPFAARVATSGVPVAVITSYAKDANLKLADKVYLFEQTAFPDGKPMNPYEDVMPIFPWLLPGGLAISAALLLAGVAGVYRERPRTAA